MISVQVQWLLLTVELTRTAYVKESFLLSIVKEQKEQLCSANGEPLNTRYKVNKGYIQNNGYCFKNIFLIVQNITHVIILGTPFLTQIDPFQVNESGVHTKILGNQISSNFLSVGKQRKVSLL